jgi:hypothetical protein
MQIKTFIGAVAMALAGLAMAQPATPNLDKREANQQQRIDQGVASGQLNAKETSRLESREAKLAADEAAAKADGKVTRAERVKLQREAHRNSRAIHRQKHDGHTAATAAANGK